MQMHFFMYALCFASVATIINNSTYQPKKPKKNGFTSPSRESLVLSPLRPRYHIEPKIPRNAVRSSGIQYDGRAAYAGYSRACVVRYIVHGAMCNNFAYAWRCRGIERYVLRSRNCRRCRTTRWQFDGW